MNWITTLTPVVGIVIAYLCFYRRNNFIERVSTARSGQLLKRFWFSGWGFDWLYETFVIAPFMFIVDFNKNDVVDSGYRLIAWLMRWLHRMLSITQTGRVRWYAAVIVLGVVGFVGLGVMR
jgi:NADH-quinone oxidoreductase subunit L